MNNSRRAAAYIVARWLVTKEFPANLLPKEKDRAFVQELVYTTIRRLRPLRKILGKFVKVWPKGELEALLYVGAAQILYLPSVPDFAAVNETVDAAKECENPTIAKVVNGVLRNILRNREEIEEYLKTTSVAERESFTNELFARWVDRFGEANAEALARWHNEPAETFLARKDGSFVALERGVRVEDVKGFSEGEFIVQDPGTAIAVELLSPQAGEHILDACAAPGGKTIQCLWRGARVTACEVNPKRRSRLEENLSRLKLSAKVISSLDLEKESFEKILVDAPCSNTGVLRRRPDARWTWSTDKMNALVKMQAQILDECARLLKSGGSLVYSTCSNEREENEYQVQDFLSRHKEFKFIDARESFPFETHYDGAFAALLQKN